MTQQLRPWLTDEIHHAVAESAAWAELARALAIPLAIEADASVRGLLRHSNRIGEGTPFAIGQPGGSAWLAVDGERVTAHRRKPEGIPAVDLGALLAREPLIVEALRSALTHGTALTAAATVLGALMGPAEVLSRQKFLYLESWAPVLEQHAYKSAAAMAASLDLMRPQLLPGDDDKRLPQAALLNEYWWRAHAIAQLSLLAADREAGSWLAAMADRIAWINWTPTFPLLRERTMWLASCAAKSAAVFGEPVVSKYLAVLERARHPVKVFDALFGLAAIALTSPGAASPIAVELRHLRNSLDRMPIDGVEYIALACEKALSVIQGHSPAIGAAEVRALLGWKDQSPQGLATEQALLADPTAITRSGHYLGFLALPTILATSSGAFNPDQSRLLARQIVKAPAIARIVRRAWSLYAEPFGDIISERRIQ